MWKTRVSELLGIDYPIIQASMTSVGTAELAGAVSAAGGLGVIHPGPWEEVLKEEIAKVRSLTDKPFGVNIPLVTTGPLERWVETIIEERVPVAITAAGDPARYTKRLQVGGVKVLHVCINVKYARKAEDAGVDGIITVGIEGGGHHGLDELTTMSLVPQVVDAVKVPVVAAGGIGDARGVVAAFALGAEGVELGTRFLLTKECIAHDNYKQALVQAKETDTIIIGRKPNRACRLLKTPVSLRWREIESRGEIPDEIPGGLENRQAAIDGDMEHGFVYAGQAAGMIKDIPSVMELMEELVQGSARLWRKLGKGPLLTVTKVGVE